MLTLKLTGVDKSTAISTCDMAFKRLEDIADRLGIIPEETAGWESLAGHLTDMEEADEMDVEELLIWMQALQSWKITYTHPRYTIMSTKTGELADLVGLPGQSAEQVMRDHGYSPWVWIALDPDK